MTYSVKDQSVQDGSPIHLYQFVQGPLVWRYCSLAKEITALGFVWAPAPVTSGTVNQSNDMTKDTLSLKLPVNHELAKVFLARVLDIVTSLTIFRGHSSDTDAEFITYWKGRVASYKANGNSVSLECEPIFTSLRRPGLRARYQKSCRHALYGNGCGLNAEGFAVTGRCSFADKVTVSIVGASALPAGWIIGGMIRLPDNSLRYVMDQVGDVLTLIRPAEQLSENVGGSGYGMDYGNFYGGVAVKMYPGCDHSNSTCASKFNNLPNYGGFPWIPGKNPFGGTSIA